MDSRPVVLVDTNVIIEAVRTGAWTAITGQFVVETVESCTEESTRGDPSDPQYVVVGEGELARISQVHPVTETERAALALVYPDADGMDGGERDLFAHVIGRPVGPRWVLCSPDKASVRAAVVLGLGDHLCSLADLVHEVGVRPKTPLRTHFEGSWLSEWRTQFLLNHL